MKTFKPSLIRTAMLASGFAFGMAPAAMAQEAANAAESDVEVINVTGIRASLIKSQALKMENNSIVEALSAEDIGKLPDTSISESLARLPGLSGERRDGRSSGISVRGFNENYIGTTLNGRELLGMGDNRGVEYDLYPSEIVSNVLVYKTPEAGMVSQGIGGTIDLQTTKPLGQERTVVLNASYEKNGMSSANPDYDDDGYRVAFNFVDSFMDDTLGVALVLASMESPSQEEQFRGWGYATANPDNAAEGVTVPEGTAILGGHDSFVRSALMQRDSIAAVVQWAPTDKLMVQLDALYIDFKEDKVKRGVEEGGAEWGTGAYTITEVTDGLVTGGYYDGFHSVVRNDAESKEADLTTIGLNVEYMINDDWTVEFDYSTGEVSKTITDIESYSGVGRAGVDGRPLTARSWSMTPTGAIYGDHPTIAPVDLTDASLIKLAGPQAWGAPIIGSDAQDGFVNQPEFDEELDSFRLQANGILEWGFISGVEAGVIYSDRKKDKINEGFYLTSPAYPGADPIPEVLGVANLNFIGINGILAYDSLGLYNSGYYTATEASLVQPDRLGDTYTVEEELTTYYAKFDIDTEIGDIFVRGNFGLQVIDVDQRSTGFDVVDTESGIVEATPVEGKANYTDVLPSLNLSFEIAENQFVRVAGSKVVSRPRMDDMRPNKQATFSFNDNQINNPDPENGPWGGSAGNPTLQSLEADQFDLSYENYYSQEGYFAVAFFYKDLKNWHRDNNFIADFSAIFIFLATTKTPCDMQPPATFPRIWLVLRKMDLEGFVRGWELQGSLPFNIISDSLDGFGLIASATFLDGELDDGTRVPGLSEESYQLTAYYENNGFEFRVSGRKRSDFATEVRGLSLSLVETIDQGAELWDAQIGYDFSYSDN